MSMEITRCIMSRDLTFSTEEENKIKSIIEEIKTRMIKTKTIKIVLEYNGGGGNSNLLSFSLTDQYGRTETLDHEKAHSLLNRAVDTSNQNFLKSLWELVHILHFGFYRDDGGYGILTVSLPLPTSEELSLKLDATDHLDSVFEPEEGEDAPFRIEMSV